MDFKHYNVHWKLGTEKGKVCLAGDTKEIAKHNFEFYASKDIGAPGAREDIPFEAEVVKVIGPLGMHQSSPKQRLAQKYGYIIGSIKGAKVQFLKICEMETETKDHGKMIRAIQLADSQFAKLQRDIRDCFKLAGLKVK